MQVIDNIGDSLDQYSPFKQITDVQITPVHVSECLRNVSRNMIKRYFVKWVFKLFRCLCYLVLLCAPGVSLQRFAHLARPSVAIETRRSISPEPIVCGCVAQLVAQQSLN